MKNNRPQEILDECKSFLKHHKQNYSPELIRRYSLSHHTESTINRALRKAISHGDTEIEREYAVVEVGGRRTRIATYRYSE